MDNTQTKKPDVDDGLRRVLSQRYKCGHFMFGNRVFFDSLGLPADRLDRPGVRIKIIGN